MKRKSHRWTLDDCRAEAQRIDPNLSPSDDAYRTAVLLIATAAHGVTKGIALVKEDAAFIAPRAERLRANGIWQGDAVDPHDWFDKEAGAIAFWMAVLVAEGMLERAPA